MNAHNKETASLPEQNQESHQIDRSKRSFAKVGVITPVILTLANRSAWGANACIGSGFQSFSTALTNGRVLSHAATDKTTHSTWMLPSSWSGALSSWPSGIVPAKVAGTSAETLYETWDATTNSWTGSDSESTLRGDGNKYFVDQLLGGAQASKTIYEALNETNSLVAYQVATELNIEAFGLGNGAPLPILLTLQDYELFYAECTTAAPGIMVP